MTDNKSITVTYDTNEDSNQNLGIGLGCNGIIDVMIEPAANAIGLYHEIVKMIEPVALGTTFTGEKYLMTFNTQSKNKIEERLLSLFETKQSHTETIDNVEVFLELIQPGFKLIIFGAGSMRAP